MEDNKIRERFLIEKFQEITPKKNWREIRDIYEYDYKKDMLLVWGNDGWYREFIFKSKDYWEIHVYPRDPNGRKIWHGYGKGWEDWECLKI